MSLNTEIPPAVRFERLSGTKRAILRLVRHQGGHCEAGYEALATALGVSRRAVEMHASGLHAQGWLNVQRRRRLPAVIRLSTLARTALATQTTTDIHPILAPTGFSGDPEALATAKIIIGMRRTATARDLAVEYLERASMTEVTRIDTLRDEHGLVPIEIQTLTGDAQLDLGLRDHFETVAQQKRRRSKLRTYLGFADG